MDGLGDLLDESRILFLDTTDKDEALARLVEVASMDPRVHDARDLLQAVREREEVMSTAIGLGVAVPHARLPSIRDIVVTVAVSHAGVDFQAFDGQPVHILVLVAAPEHGHAEYMKVLGRLSRLLRDDRLRERLVRAETATEVGRLLGR